MDSPNEIVSNGSGGCIVATALQEEAINSDLLSEGVTF